MMLARYFMFSQVYLHPVRRIYDIHLKDYLKESLTGGAFSTRTENHLRLTDNDITSALFKAARNQKAKGHVHAKRIVNRSHFKLLYDRNPQDLETNQEAGRLVFDALCERFDPASFRHDRKGPKGGAPLFPVELRNGQIVSSLEKSENLDTIPDVSIDSVFAERSTYEVAQRWLEKHRGDIIRPAKEEN